MSPIKMEQVADRVNGEEGRQTRKAKGVLVATLHYTVSKIFNSWVTAIFHTFDTLQKREKWETEMKNFQVLLETKNIGDFIRIRGAIMRSCHLFKVISSNMEMRQEFAPSMNFYPKSNNLAESRGVWQHSWRQVGKSYTKCWSRPVKGLWMMPNSQ